MKKPKMKTIGFIIFGLLLLLPFAKSWAQDTYHIETDQFNNKLTVEKTPDEASVLPANSMSPASLPVPEEDTETRKYALNPLISIDLAYQTGNIGTYSAGLGLGLSRLFGIPADEAAPLVFLVLNGGFDQKTYQSVLFNEDEEYDFSFYRAGAGLNLILPIGPFSIVPEFTFGAERATPKTANVHEKIDDNHLTAFYYQPKLAMGLALSKSFVLQAAASYYLFRDDVYNADQKILAVFDEKADTYTPLKYADDFFEDRKGLSFAFGVKFLF